MPLPDPIWVFVSKLEAAQLPYFVTGSVATIFYGEPRLTHDIDLVVHLESPDLQRFQSLFVPTEYYCPPVDVLQIEMKRRPYGHFNVIHHASGFNADIYFEGTDPLHRWALSHRKRIEINDSQSLWLPPPEYLILRKLEFYREGSADKHLRDIESMLPQVAARLDQKFLEEELAKRGLESFWQKIRKP